MNPDAHVKSVIAKYALVNGLTPAAKEAAQKVYQVIQAWAGMYLLGVTYSGSIAKGTAIAGIADVDLFISLNNETPGTLSEIYNSLANDARFRQCSPRRQNVSVGITYAGQQIDLVPGRKQSGNTTNHSLYRSKAHTWTQTNVEKHVSLVRNSGRLDEIRTFKIWRALHGLEFPSFYLEMTVINALSGVRSTSIAANVAKVLHYLKDDLVSSVVIDPSNSNNKLSDDLTIGERKCISEKAAAHLKANWTQVLW